MPWAWIAMQAHGLLGLHGAQPLADLCLGQALAARPDDRGGDEVAVLGIAFVAGSDERSRVPAPSSRPGRAGRRRPAADGKCRGLRLCLRDDLDDAAGVARADRRRVGLDPDERAVADPRHGRAGPRLAGQRDEESWGGPMLLASHSAGSATSSPSRSRPLMSASDDVGAAGRPCGRSCGGDRARLRLPSSFSSCFSPMRSPPWMLKARAISRLPTLPGAFATKATSSWREGRVGSDRGDLDFLGIQARWELPAQQGTRGGKRARGSGSYRGLDGFRRGKLRASVSRIARNAGSERPPQGTFFGEDVAAAELGGAPEVRYSRMPGASETPVNHGSSSTRRRSAVHGGTGSRTAWKGTRRTLRRALELRIAA